MKRAQRELNTDLIDSLERELFPFQESEEEQESFTPEGRKRVDKWLTLTLGRAVIRATVRAHASSRPPSQRRRVRG